MLPIYMVVCVLRRFRVPLLQALGFLLIFLALIGSPVGEDIRMTFCVMVGGSSCRGFRSVPGPS